MYIVTLENRMSLMEPTTIYVAEGMATVMETYMHRHIWATYDGTHEYEIVLGREVYICRETMGDDGVICLGNPRFLSEENEDTGEPFLICCTNNETSIYVTNPGTLEVSVTGMVANEIHGADIKLKSGKVIQGINSIDSFSFTVLMNNPGFYQAHDLTTLVKVYNTRTKKYVFHGRVLYSDTTMSETGLITKDVTCESNLGFLCDSQQPVVGVRNWTVTELFQHIIDKHNEQIEPYKRFTVGKVTVTDPNDNLYIGIQYANTWETLKEKLIDKLGGELWMRVENGVNYLDYLESYGSTGALQIKLAHNMKSIKQEKDPSAYITRLIPLGMKMGENDERLTIAEANGGLDYIDDEAGIAQYGIHVGYHEWDDVTDAYNLMTKAQAWLTENNRLKIKYSITALDLSLLGLDYGNFNLGWKYRIYNSLLEINSELVRVVKKTIDVCEEIKSTFEVGDNFLTASDIQISQAQEAKKIYSKITKTDEEIRIHVANEIEGVNGTISATSEAILLEIRGEDGNGGLSGRVSSIEATLDNITLSVSNGETSSTIRLMSGSTEIDSAEIKLTGVVTFAGLKDGSTTIDGGCIKTGTIDADRLNLTGQITFSDLNTETQNKINNAGGLNEEQVKTVIDNKLVASPTIKGGAFYDYYGIAKLTLTTTHLDDDCPTLSFKLPDDNHSMLEVYPSAGNSLDVVMMLAGYPILQVNNEDYAGYVTVQGEWDFSEATVNFNGASADDLGITFDVPEPDLSDISISSIGAGTAWLSVEMFGSYGYCVVANRSLVPDEGDEYVGLASYPWAGLYADSCSCCTSDENKKNSIEELPEKYLVMFDNLHPKRFKMNNGTSNRYHTGYTTQDVKAAMDIAEVDSTEFGGWIKDTDPDGGDIYFLRYEEFGAIYAAKIKQLEARVARLEEA